MGYFAKSCKIPKATINKINKIKINFSKLGNKMRLTPFQGLEKGLKEDFGRL